MKKDDQLDRLLRQTSRPHDERPVQGECIEPETLAAWTDGTLNSAQRAAAETHAADCERCLALLAAIARTAPPPVMSQSPRWSVLRWAAPLTTAAVAITAWIVVQQPLPEREEPRPAVAATEAQKPAESLEQVETPAKTLNDPIEKKEAPPAPPAVRAEKPQPERQRTAAAAPAPASRGADARADASETSSVARFAAQAPIVVSSPDPNIRWRISNRQIERSSDAGRTWNVQLTDAEGELLAGAAPGADICWIIGRTGIVLVTTDGVTWQRVDFPDRTATLVRVVAASSLDASVSTSDGRTYRTTDGGRTWTLQENPGSTF